MTIRFKKKKTTIYNVDLAPVIEVTKWPEQLTEGWEIRARKGESSHWRSSKFEGFVMQLINLMTLQSHQSAGQGRISARPTLFVRYARVARHNHFITLSVLWSQYSLLNLQLYLHLQTLGIKHCLLRDVPNSVPHFCDRFPWRNCNLNYNLVPRIFSCHTVIMKRNEHPDTWRSTLPWKKICKFAAIMDLWFACQR